MYQIAIFTKGAATGATLHYKTLETVEIANKKIRNMGVQLELIDDFGTHYITPNENYDYSIVVPLDQEQLIKLEMEVTKKTSIELLLKDPRALQFVERAPGLNQPEKKNSSILMDA